MPDTFLGPGEVKCCQGRTSQQWNKLLLWLELKDLAKKSYFQIIFCLCKDYIVVKIKRLFERSNKVKRHKG